ncbi:hypothetical protein CYLTODRAFT_419855 [Cylindrobasidium torrendii FP15055 ss-10]|uniref:CDC14-domain-containing protein n=1 Tax=Cylindrobasidium torrendii FP15055 ss-10 TaxID=1314674 RepID=A0A0D7BJH1_9AGAR|nr:hypothetical protein CYLTODRAFT_419855 [Cylindrobasidium torrendii FP15055 ss-10]
MGDQLMTIRGIIQDALDDILSPRSSLSTVTFAFRRLERTLADYVRGDAEKLELFVALQHTFECNVPSRLTHWITQATQKLEAAALAADPNHELLTQLPRQLTVALSILQGIAMLHEPTKVFLGRKYPIEVMIDLLLASRHISPITTPTKSKTPESVLPLTSVVLDALLCILVDAPAALRVFEECKGVQAIVKILKRAGTPREVRMKCLEFLYFYLLDEDTAELELSFEEPSTPRPNAPPSRGPSKKLFPNATPSRPSRQASYSSSSNSSRSTSTGSVSSVSSLSSPPASTATSPTKTSFVSPPCSPPPAQSRVNRSLRMLKEVDFVPQSPMRPSALKPGPNASRRVPSSQNNMAPTQAAPRLASPFGSDASPKPRGLTRSTEEKKEFLGTLMGNVDALVEGVRKAGIWGLN